jgi:hypothetical protein
MSDPLDNVQNCQTPGMARTSRTRGVDPLVCLNFKVPLRTRQQFKQYAARHNMSMTDLLLHLLDDCLKFEASLEGQSPCEVKK